MLSFGAEGATGGEHLGATVDPAALAVLPGFLARSPEAAGWPALRPLSAGFAVFVVPDLRAMAPSAAVAVDGHVYLFGSGFAGVG